MQQGFDLEVGAGMPGSTQPGDRSFVHLHVHSEYSMLDGAARVADLFSGCEQMGMPAIAVTDHGNTFGAYEFYKAGRASSVKPIIGIEAYLTPKTHRSERRRVLWGDGGSDDVSGRRSIHPSDHVGREHSRDAQPVSAELAGLPGGLLLQAAGGSRTARSLRRWTDRDDRLPGRGGTDLPAAGPLSTMRSPALPSSGTCLAPATTSSS